MAKKKQRENGAGTVYPRKNKAGKIIGYRGSYFVDTADGPKRLYVSGRTKTETEKALRKVTVVRGGGLLFEVGNLTLGSYLDRWLPNIRGTVRQRTWERYEQIVRVHLKPALGKKQVKSLTPTHVRGLYRHKLDGGSSRRTVQYIHTTLRKALKDAVSDGLIPRNATDVIKAPRPKQKEINPLSPEQAKAFLQAVREDRLEALLRSSHTPRFEAGRVAGVVLGGR